MLTPRSGLLTAFAIAYASSTAPLWAQSSDSLSFTIEEVIEAQERSEAAKEANREAIIEFSEDEVLEFGEDQPDEMTFQESEANGGFLGFAADDGDGDGEPMTFTEEEVVQADDGISFTEEEVAKAGDDDLSFTLEDAAEALDHISGVDLLDTAIPGAGCLSPAPGDNCVLTPDDILIVLGMDKEIRELLEVELDVSDEPCTPPISSGGTELPQPKPPKGAIRDGAARGVVIFTGNYGSKTRPVCGEMHLNGFRTPVENTLGLRLSIGASFLVQGVEDGVREVDDLNFTASFAPTFAKEFVENASAMERLEAFNNSSIEVTRPELDYKWPTGCVAQLEVDQNKGWVPTNPLGVNSGNAQSFLPWLFGSQSYTAAGYGSQAYAIPWIESEHRTLMEMGSSYVFESALGNGDGDKSRVGVSYRSTTETTGSPTRLQKGKSGGFDLASHSGFARVLVQRIDDNEALIMISAEGVGPDGFGTVRDSFQNESDGMQEGCGHIGPKKTVAVFHIRNGRHTR